VTALDAGLLCATVLTTVVLVMLARALIAALERIAVLERRAARSERRRSSPTDMTSPPTRTRQEEPVPEPVEQPAGDAVDIRGVDVTGTPVTIALEHKAEPTLVAFLSTTCGICLGLWEHLRDDGLTSLDTVVVTKDGAVEDVARAESMTTSGHLPVVMSSEAWDDYEVPGSPYFLVVGGNPTTVLAEGSADSWSALQDIAGAGSRA
jgi:hypothetical protein